MPEGPDIARASPRRRALRLHAAALWFVTAAGAASAQTGGLEVTVVDADGSPLPGATVTISHDTGSVKTTAALTDGERERLERGLRDSDHSGNVRAGAWQLRYALDDVVASLTKRDDLRSMMTN